MEVSSQGLELSHSSPVSQSMYVVIDTNSVIVVHQLLNSLLSSINQETKLRDISNGDIIQALSMALGVRVKMMYGDDKVKEDIAINCVKKALNSCKYAKEQEQISGTS